MERRVALVSCAEYTIDQVETAVRQSVSLLGGMGRFVKPGQQVLVKPNLLQPSDPAKAIVTHPVVLQAVVKLVQEAGGQVVIADNPVVIPVTQRSWQSAYEKVGWAAVAAETGARLNSHIVPQQRPHPEGKLIRVVDTSSFVTEADVVISVPKLKTHDFMRFTGAVKNLFGTVPGTTKFGYHVKLQTSDRFADMLLDLATFVRPALTVMDAVVGMDGDGPSAGRPFPIGAILAGPDPVALDMVALALVGHDPASVPTVSRAIRRGWTSGRVSDLELVGDDLASWSVSGFRLPPGGPTGTHGIPDLMRRWGTRLLVASPLVGKQCIGCGLCIENCPAQTIARVGERVQINLANCIRCYCCHELCPEQAIELCQPWLRQILARLGQ
jgi:uncharacterized protein (DUF362 family)/NAD-dependent dihydropyrimidine dehydrogenase PreA subunit